MAETIHIEANEELFNEIKYIGLRVSDLSSIVQNDMDVGAEEILEFVFLVEQAKRDITEWAARVQNHIYTSNVWQKH